MQIPIKTILGAAPPTVPVLVLREHDPVSMFGPQGAQWKAESCGSFRVFTAPTLDGAQLVVCTSLLGWGGRGRRAGRMVTVSLNPELRLPTDRECEWIFAALRGPRGPILDFPAVMPERIGHGHKGVGRWFVAPPAGRN